MAKYKVITGDFTEKKEQKQNKKTSKPWAHLEQERETKEDIA